ncbi:MAG: site-specific integrase [Alphaproteobacteria bacterium]|nr:site-specific integrase [Microthrixaceae bacterium]MCB9685988.1 site-specific integrase [Alphaproteobacteria bacterium]MCB9686014.1 site-specific integrase [Alphaproteobacteria bacterium]MCB9686016.1 site-specific integrase [Alphaproteobacteria bacterium]MCB9686073.1 site-specific integrase [Alphaproteobacteria bacterium]
MGHVRDRFDADLRLAGRSESTRKTYIGCAVLFVKFFMRPPDQLGEKEVRQFLLSLRDRKLSVGRYLQYLGALKFLFGITLGRPQVTDGIPWPRMHRKRPDILTREEVTRVLDAASSPFWRMYLTTAYAAGLRRMEVAALRAEHIDGAAGLLRVAHGKGDKKREVMLDPELYRQLREHWRTHALPGPWLFPARSRSGGWADHPVDLGQASASFRAAADAAGIRRCRVTLHSLRSAFATHLFEDDVDIFTIQQLLGHERLETTGRYAVVRTDRIRETPSPLSKLPK